MCVCVLEDLGVSSTPTGSLFYVYGCFVSIDIDIYVYITHVTGVLCWWRLSSRGRWIPCSYGRFGTSLRVLGTEVGSSVGAASELSC